MVAKKHFINFPHRYRIVLLLIEQMPSKKNILDVSEIREMDLEIRNIFNILNEKLLFQFFLPDDGNVLRSSFSLSRIFYGKHFCLKFSFSIFHHFILESSSRIINTATAENISVRWKLWVINVIFCSSVFRLVCIKGALFLYIFMQSRLPNRTNKSKILLLFSPYSQHQLKNLFKESKL